MPSALVPPPTPSESRDSSSTETPSNGRRQRRTNTSHPADSFWNRAPWSWLVSIRMGLVLLAILTVASIVGTLIDPLERAQAVIYYTWWYKLLLLALAVNMSFATVQTVVKKVLPSRALRLQTNPAFFENASPRGECEFDGDIEQVAAEFRQQGCAVLVEGDVGVARRGWIGRFGAPISHIGMVVVLLAGFISSWVAREGVVRIVEGRSVDTMTLRDKDRTQVPLGFTLALDDFSTGYFPQTRIPSHFVSNVTASLADDVLYSGPVEVNHSPLVKGWRLHQTSYEELPNLQRQTVLVTPPDGSTPISAEISIGQPVPLAGMKDTWMVFEEGGIWNVLENSSVVASGSVTGGHGHGENLSIRAEQFEPDFVLGEDRQVTSRSQELNNPALKVILLSDGKPVATQWLFGRADMKQFSHNANDHYALELMETRMEGEQPTFVVKIADGHSDLLLGQVELALNEEKPIGNATETAEAAAEDQTAGWSVALGAPVTAHATVLTLTRNPTLLIIYGGCGLMMIGLLLGFFVRRREVWFMVNREAGKLCLVAHYRHPTDELDATTASIMGKLASSPVQS